MESADDAASPGGAGEAKALYVVPRYRAEGDPAWYHVLHGTVPGHQIDFMYCPEVPQGRLTQTHFGHLARLMKYIEPRQGAPYAFALGNLSRDDVQHEPGHGGLALIFALRVAGVTDHAGRATPPYAHGVLAIDRTLDYATLLQAISGFYRRFLDSGSRSEDANGNFYRSYVRVMEERPETVEGFLSGYIRDFDELPQPQESKLRFDWEAGAEALPRRLSIVHADDEPFENVAHAAALLGAMLYKSNIKWTTITSGREIEIPGGLSIRFVPASEMPRDGRCSGAGDTMGLVLPLGDLPDREDDLAQQIFGAIPRASEAKVTRGGWREALVAAASPEMGPASGAEKVSAVPAPSSRVGGTLMPEGAAAAPAPSKAPGEPALTDGPAGRSRLGMWIGIVGGLGVIAAIAAAMAGGAGDPKKGSGAAEVPSAKALTAPADLSASSAPSVSSAPSAVSTGSMTQDIAPAPGVSEPGASEPGASEPSLVAPATGASGSTSGSKEPGRTPRPSGGGARTKSSLRQPLRIPGQ